MKIELAMAALVAGGGSAPSPPARGEDTVAINFGRGVGWSGREAVEIQRVGPSTLQTTYNHDGRPEIGVWQNPVAAETFEHLVSLARQSRYESIPSPSVVPPGTHMVDFGERKAGQAAPTLHTFVTVPAALAPCVAAIDTINSSLKAHPLRVLRGELKSSRATVQRGDRLFMELKLTNVGRAALTFSNPLSTSKGWNGLRVVLLDASGANVASIDLTADDVPAGGQSRSPFLPLGPGETARFELRPKLDVPAGKYPGRLEYHSMATPSDDAQFVGGTLALPTGAITVERAAWWKVW